VYDLATHRFLTLHDHWVEPILNGEIVIDFAAQSAVELGGKLRRHIRNLALKSPTTYRLVQRARGFRLSPQEVRALRERLRRAEASSQSSSPSLTLARATMGPAKLDSETVVLSGGLDWEHKNVRQIYHLKQKDGFRYFSIVYDLIPVSMPQYVVPHYVALLTEYFGELLWASDGCLCISETTRSDLLKFYDENSVDPPRTQSFPLGSDLATKTDFGAPNLEILPDSLRDKKFVLYVSTIEPRKNHRTAYEAWCHAMLAGNLDPGLHRLVFVGRQGWNVGDLMHEMETNPITRNTVLRLSDVSDVLLRALYTHCAFVIFPSYYEGFGLPLVEAFANGKVCVTSGAGALKEIRSPLRIDIDPRDTLKWSSTISELLTNPEKVREYGRKIDADSKPVSWDESAKQFFEIVKTWSAS
jgi:glycosyltransferase involved in cell wall biosynthesis